MSSRIDRPQRPDYSTRTEITRNTPPVEPSQTTPGDTSQTSGTNEPTPTPTSQGESVSVNPNLGNESPESVHEDVSFPDFDPSIGSIQIAAPDHYDDAKQIILKVVNGNLSPEELVQSGVDFSNVLEQIVEGDGNFFTQGNSREQLIQIADLLLHKIKEQGNEVDGQLKVMLDQVLNRIGEDIRTNQPPHWHGNLEGVPNLKDQQNIPAQDDQGLQNLLHQLEENQGLLEGIQGVDTIQTAATSLMYDPVADANGIVDEMVRLAQGNEGSTVSIYELKDQFKQALESMTPEQLLEVAGHMSDVLADQGAEVADGRIAYMLQRHVLPALQNAQPSEEVSEGITEIRSQIEGIDLGGIEDLIQVDNTVRAKALIDEISSGNLSPAELLQKSMEFARVMEDISETEMFLTIGNDGPQSRMLEIAGYISEKMAQGDNQSDKSLGVLMNEVTSRLENEIYPHGLDSIISSNKPEHAHLFENDASDVNEATAILEQFVELNNLDSEVDKDDRRMELSDRFQELVQGMDTREQLALLRHMNAILTDENADAADNDMAALIQNYVLPELQPRIEILGEPIPWNPGIPEQPWDSGMPNIIIQDDSVLRHIMINNQAQEAARRAE